MPRLLTPARALILGLPLAGCAGPDPDADGAGASIPSAVLDLPVLPDAAGIVLIQADALRADHLWAYGYERNTTPWMSTLPWRVVHGVKATSSWTAPSSASLLTGLDLHEHGIHSADTDALSGTDALLDAPTFAEHLSDLGFATGLFSGNAFVASATGLDRGFDKVVVRGEDAGISNAAVLADDALSWVAALPAGQPFFLVLHVMDPHTPFSPEREDRGVWSDPDERPFDYDESEEDQFLGMDEALSDPDDAARAAAAQAIRDVYDEQLLGMDRGIMGLLDGLRQEGRLEGSMVVFTADHGETIGERWDHVVGHGTSLHAELVDLPFLLLHPAILAGHTPCAASNRDILPTVLRTVGLPQPDGISGHPLQRGCRVAGRSSLYETNAGTQLKLIAVRSPDRSIIRTCQDRRDVTFDLTQDPTEEGPGAPREGAVDPVLVTMLDAFAAEVASTVDRDPCLADP